MDVRLRELENALAELRSRLDRLEQRLGSSESQIAPSATTPPPSAAAEELRSAAAATRALERVQGELASGQLAMASDPAVSGPLPLEPLNQKALSVVALAGRTLLVLGGAFVIRALAEEGVLAGPAGPLLGLCFAGVWVFFAYRSAAESVRGSATVHGVAAALIVYPLLVESATRLGSIPHVAAPVLLGGFTAALLAVAWRRKLPALAWVVVLACALTSLLMIRLGNQGFGLPVLVLLLAVGAAVASDANGWNGLRWPAALAAQLVALRSAMVVGRAPDVDLTAEAALGLSFVVFAVAAAALPLRTLVRRQGLRVFEIAQALLATWVVMIAVLRLTPEGGGAQLSAGALLLLLAAGAFLLGLFVLPADKERVFDSFVYTGLGTGLVFGGGMLALQPSLRGAAWAVLAVAMAWMGRRVRPRTLLACGAVLLGGAAVNAGLFEVMISGFLSSAASTPEAIQVAALIVLGCSIGAYAMAAPSGAEASGGGSWQSRLAPAFMLLLGVLGVAAVAVAGFRAALRVTDPAVLASARTVSIGAAVLGLAIAARLVGRRELAWAAYGLVVFGGIKLVLEDLRNGRAVTLLVGFVAFGAALIAVARLLAKASKGAAAAQPPPTEAR